MHNIEAISEELRNLKRKKHITGWCATTLIDDVGTYESEQVAERFGTRWTIVRDGKPLYYDTEGIIEFISGVYLAELNGVVIE